MNSTAPAEQRAVPPLRLRTERHSALIKWGVILDYNIITFLVAWLINGKPIADPSQWPLSMFAPFFPGAVGGTILVLIGTIIDWTLLRYVLIANLAAIIPLLYGGEFIRRLYRFETFGLALGYLREALFAPDPHYSNLPHRAAGPMSAVPEGKAAGRSALIRNGKLTPANNRPQHRSIAWAGGPGAVTVPSGYAVQMEHGGRLTRLVGAGVARLGRFEKVFKLIDLRQIVRKKEFTALTGDGIPVTVEVTVHCCIQAGSNSPSPACPYPYDATAIRRLTLTTTVDESGPIAWEERIIALAGSALNTVLARYRLHELFEPLDELADPRLTIQEEIRQALRQQAHPYGVEVTELWLGPFELPAGATKQFVASWEAARSQQAATTLSDKRAPADRSPGHTRAEAQREIIETLVAAFEADRGPLPGPQLALRLLGGLEQLHGQASPVENEEPQGPVSDQRLAELRHAIERDLASAGRRGPENGGDSEPQLNEDSPDTLV